MANDLPTISLCMIVKDEERLLAGCLASAGPFVDQIVVVDTGSRDGTLAIARERAQVVLEAPWQDDFAAARNASIAPATGDWVLFLDADERLEAAGGARLKTLLSRAGGRTGFTLAMHNHAANGGLTTHQVGRLFKNGLGLRFSGRVHEQLDWPEPPTPLPVTLHHLGYAKSRQELAAKGEQRLALLRARLAEAPQDFNATVHLARALLIHGGDPEEVLALGRAALEMATRQNIQPEALPWAMHPVFKALFQLGRHQELASVAQAASESYPTWPDGWFALLLARVKLAQWEPALAAAEEFLGWRERWAADPANYPHRQNASGGEALTALWHACLAAAHLGRDQSAALYAARLREDPRGGGSWPGLIARLRELGFERAARLAEAQAGPPR